MTYLEKKNEMIEKYKNALGAIGKLNPMPDGTEADLGVAFVMLQNNYLDIQEGKEPLHVMPEEWLDEDYKAFGKDYAELTGCNADTDEQ